MKPMVLAAAAAAVLSLSGTAAVAQVRGSYLATCWDVYQNGPVLSAVCETANGRARQTQLDLRNCRGGDVANINGRLACAGRRAPPPPQYWGEPRPHYQPYNPYQPRW